MKLTRAIVALCLLVVTGLASAANYTLWINGRAGSGANGVPGDYNNFSYWGPASTPA